MATKKSGKAVGKKKPAPASKPATPASKPATPVSKPTKPVAKGYTSAAWERVYLMSLELEALARELGITAENHAEEGFDLTDAAKEVGRLARNHDRNANPATRSADQERDDWVALGGLGADLGNMADDEPNLAAADGTRAIAYELCYLTCDYLF